MIELNKIYNAECLEFMRSMPDDCIDLVVTDPPSVLDSTTPGKTSIGNTQKYKTAEYKKICSGFDIEAIFGELKRISKKFNLFCFCSNAQLSKITGITQLVWCGINIMRRRLLMGFGGKTPNFVCTFERKGLYFKATLN